LVVAGAPPGPPRPADSELRAAVTRREAAGTSRREAIAAVAQEYGLPRREVYNLIVAGPARSSPGPPRGGG
jgi:16S rRNA (cytidine1402-2'-O)-methyltransferase